LVILAEIVDNSVTAEPEPISENLRRVVHFALGLAKIRPAMGNHRPMRAWPRSFSGQSGTGMPGSITTSRMVKKTVGSDFASFPLAHCRPRVTAAIRGR
jgi:hypothetical protein